MRSSRSSRGRKSNITNSLSLMTDEIKFQCQECGKTFDPDPAAMVESEMAPQLTSASEADRLEDAGAVITTEMLAAATDEDLAEWGLTSEDRAAMLAGEAVTTGGMCICLECQDALAGDQA